MRSLRGWFWDVRVIRTEGAPWWGGGNAHTSGEEESQARYAEPAGFGAWMCMN